MSGGVPVDLTNCDREPIHVPGAILPHGAMLVVDEDSLEILQIAGDTLRLLGSSPAGFLGRGLGEAIGPDRAQRVRAVAESSDLRKPRHLLDPALRVRADQPVDVSIHRPVTGRLAIEFEEADPADPHAIDPLACVQAMLDGLDGAATLPEFCQTAAERVRTLAGYDRVMVYRFQEDDSGWVFAEARDPALVPFLDLHYPASDIPVQARALYLRSWIRLIAEVDYEPAPLTPELDPRTGQPLDMGHATLRDVSPIHREYLRNMGVGASMSISIVVEGRLWGLIACHHRTPRRLPRHLRAICELFGAMFSLQLEARGRAELLQARLSSRRLLHEIMGRLVTEEDYGSALAAQAPRLMEYVEAGGLALRVGGKGGVAIKVNNGIRATGETPTEEQIGALTDWLAGRMGDGDGLFITDRLGELWHPAAAFAAVGSGLLALSISVEPRDFILWFRPEAIEMVRWAGDPSKPVESGPNGDRLTPRKSFEAWEREVRGRATPWSPSDAEAAADLRLSLLDVVLRRVDAVARERARALEQERLLMHELDHRVKNTLASIQALVSQTSRSASSLLDFTSGLERRIRAMSKAHGLLTESRWAGVAVAELVAQELDQYGPGGERFTATGPRVVLTSKAALALALAIHELATNAAKYGALSVPDGRVALRWTLGDGGGLDLLWTESHGPVVLPPKRRGFGSTLIERAMALETGGTASLRFDPSGVVCEVSLPPAAITSVDAPGPGAAPAEAAPEPPAAEAVPARRCRILVVEDSALVLMELEIMLETMGFEPVGPATRLPEALRLAETEPLDAALLDVNLDGEMSWPVAERLRQRGVGFAFTTGYDASTILPAAFAGSPVLEKPFRPEDIRRCVAALLEATGPAATDCRHPPEA